MKPPKKPFRSALVPVKSNTLTLLKSFKSTRAIFPCFDPLSYGAKYPYRPSVKPLTKPFRSASVPVKSNILAYGPNGTNGLFANDPLFRMCSLLVYKFLTFISFVVLFNAASNCSAFICSSTPASFSRRFIFCLFILTVIVLRLDCYGR